MKRELPAGMSWLARDQIFLAVSCPGANQAAVLEICPAPANPPGVKRERHNMKGRMTMQAAARIQSATARSLAHVSKGSFAARAQAAAAKSPAPTTQGTSNHGKGQAPAN
jgi:hypothetical protein